MVIRVADLVGAADTSEHGVRVHEALVIAMRQGGAVTISFDGIASATSSFVNAAFVDLLDDYSFDDIKTRVRIVESARQINAMIRARLSFEASRPGLAPRLSA